MPLQKYYYYSYGGKLLKRPNPKTVALVSTVKLPPFSAKYKGECATDVGFSGDIRLGDTVDLAFGDPRVIRGCILLSTSSDIPQRAKRAIAGGEVEASRGDLYILTFSYRDGTIWVSGYHICRLDDLVGSADE